MEAGSSLASHKENCLFHLPTQIGYIYPQGDLAAAIAINNTYLIYFTTPKMTLTKFHDFQLPCGLSQNVDLNPIQPLGSSGHPRLEKHARNIISPLKLRWYDCVDNGSAQKRGTYPTTIALEHGKVMIIPVRLWGILFSNKAPEVKSTRRAGTTGTTGPWLG